MVHPQRIIGIDPGLTTGLVSFTVVEDEIACIESYELDYRGVGSYLSTALHQGDLVACESFTITLATAKKSQAPWSLEVIGIVRYMCSRYQLEPRLSAPVTNKGLISDGVLKRAGLYDFYDPMTGKKPASNHIRDAARAALYLTITELGLMKHVLIGQE